MKSNSILADFLKAKRVAAQLTQSQVAKKLGYSTPQFISNWERGISSPPIMTLRVLSEMYKVSAEDMFEVILESTIATVTSDLKREFYRGKKANSR